MKLGKKVGILFTLAITLLLGACHPGMGGHHGGDPAKHMEKMSKMMIRKLDLNEGQQVKLKKIQEILSERPEEKPEDAHKQKMNDLQNLILQDKISSEEILDHMKPKKERMEEKMPRLAEAIADFHASLSLSQKEQIVEHLEDWK